MGKNLKPSEFGSLQNFLYASAKMVCPEVGMGATRISWTDRHSYDIVEVVSPTEIYVVNIEGNQMRTLVKQMSDGTWREDGSWSGSFYFIGMRVPYYDPHF